MVHAIRCFARAALGASTLFVPQIAAAQQATRVGVAVETALPAHQLSQAFNSALGVELFGERQFRDSPFSARLGVGYRSFVGSSTWHLRVTSLEATGQYSFKSLPLSPFLLGGLGAYSTLERATVPGSVNGVAHDASDRRTQSLGEVFGAGVSLPIGSVHIPLTYKYHRVGGVQVQNGPVGFSTFSFGISF